MTHTQYIYIFQVLASTYSESGLKIGLKYQFSKMVSELKKITKFIFFLSEI